jgi:hypothetical protein
VQRVSSQIQELLSTRRGVGRLLLAIFVLSQLLYFVHITTVHHSHSAITGNVVHEHIAATPSTNAAPTKCSIDISHKHKFSHEDTCYIIMTVSHFAFTLSSYEEAMLNLLLPTSEVQAQELEEVYLNWSLLRLAPKHSPPLTVFA